MNKKKIDPKILSVIKAKMTALGGMKDIIDTKPQDKKKLYEQRLRPAVVSFGRMNPPTVGHEKLVNKVKSVARERRGKPLIFLSHSQDSKKNPLDYADKLKFARIAFGRSLIVRSTARTIIDVAKEVDKKYDNLVVVVGDDRVNEFDTLLNKYNGKEYNFDTIEVVSAGTRDPDSSDVTGMSASKMRGFVSSGDEEAFERGLPLSLRTKSGQVFDAVRLNLKEAIQGNSAGNRLAASRRAGGAAGAAARRASAAARIANPTSQEIQAKAAGEAMGMVSMDIFKEIGAKDPELMSPQEKIVAANIAAQKQPSFKKYYDQRLAANKRKEVPTGKSIN